MLDIHNIHKQLHFIGPSLKICYSADQKIPCFCGTGKFIIVFSKVGELTLFWSSWIQPTVLRPIYPRSILSLPFHLCLVLPSGYFPPGFAANTSNAFITVLILTITHLIFHDIMSLTISGTSVREADHSPPSIAGNKNTWNHTSTPQYAFMARCSVKAQGQLKTISSTNFKAFHYVIFSILFILVHVM
jgi:hypothetical protein